MIEMLKSWNKMHDTSAESSINGFNYCIDAHLGNIANNVDMPITAAYFDGTNDEYMYAIRSLMTIQGDYGRC